MSRIAFFTIARSGLIVSILQYYVCYVKTSRLTWCSRIAPMKRKISTGPAAPVTSIRINADLVYRAKQLALRNKRDGLAETSFTAIVNAALVDYLSGKKRGA